MEVQTAAINTTLNLMANVFQIKLQPAGLHTVLRLETTTWPILTRIELLKSI